MEKLTEQQLSNASLHMKIAAYETAFQSLLTALELALRHVEHTVQHTLRQGICSELKDASEEYHRTAYGERLTPEQNDHLSSEFSESFQDLSNRVARKIGRGGA